MAPASAKPTLSNFPEELQERILDFCIAKPPTERPSWHKDPSTLSPLLVSKALHRISLPLFYHTIRLTSSQAHSLLPTFSSHPQLAPYVHHVVIAPRSAHPDSPAVLKHCRSVQTLEIELWDGDGDIDCEALCDVLDTLKEVKHLILRKPPTVYLSQPSVRHIIARLSNIIQCSWTQLETVNIAFRFDETSGIANALSHCPHLHTFATVLPSIWNESILTISRNERLEKIILSSNAGVPGVMSTGLYMNEANKWTRLMELIRCGTPIVRHRAHTMGTPHLGITIPKPVSRTPAQVCASPKSAAASSSSTQPLRGRSKFPQRRQTMA